MGMKLLSGGPNNRKRKSWPPKRRIKQRKPLNLRMKLKKIKHYAFTSETTVVNTESKEKVATFIIPKDATENGKENQVDAQTTTANYTMANSVMVL